MKNMCGAIVNRGLLAIGLAVVSSLACGVEPVPKPSVGGLDLSSAVLAARQQYPDIEAAEAAVREAEALLVQAQVLLPNPELEVLAGKNRARRVDGLSGNSQFVQLSQPLQWPAARAARMDQARSGIEAAEADVLRVQADLARQVKLAYINVLRAQEVWRLAQADHLNLLTIRDRVRAMVSVGEAPRYEAVKAEAEVLSAARLMEQAKYRHEAAQSLLARLTGGASSRGVVMLSGKLADMPDLAALQSDMETHNPAYARARALVAAARAQVREARIERTPAPTLKAGLERAPDSELWLVGVHIPIPLFDQRQGQVAAAESRLDRALALGRQEVTVLERELEQGYLNFRGAEKQLEAIEGGLLAEAQAALRVAEAAYRAGERGILDVIDALRTLRSVQLDRIQTLYDLYAALFELERLSGQALLREI